MQVNVFLRNLTDGYAQYHYDKSKMLMEPQPRETHAEFLQAAQNHTQQHYRT